MDNKTKIDAVAKKAEENNEEDLELSEDELDGVAGGHGPRYYSNQSDNNKPGNQRPGIRKPGRGC